MSRHILTSISVISSFIVYLVPRNVLPFFLLPFLVPRFHSIREKESSSDQSMNDFSLDNDDFDVIEERVDGLLKRRGSNFNVRIDERGDVEERQRNDHRLLDDDAGLLHQDEVSLGQLLLQHQPNIRVRNLFVAVHIG